MQLVAYGAQDIYLTGNPQITFFKVVYRRHTNFSMECIRQTINGNNNFRDSGEGNVTISRNGDLVHKIYVETGADNIVDGSKIVHEAELEIGGQRIERHFNDWHEAWNELSTPESKALGLKSMQGCIGSTGPIAAGILNSVQIPLQFWFCRNPGLALPLIALQYHEVKVKITWDNAPATNNPGATADTTCEVWCDYIYLDTDERRRFAQVSHEYLIEQIQRQTLNITGTSINDKLNFNHPVKELVWTYPATNNVNNLQLKLNGHERFAKQKESYFTLRQPYDYHTAVPRQNLPTVAQTSSATALLGLTMSGAVVASTGSLAQADQATGVTGIGLAGGVLSATAGFFGDGTATAAFPTGENVDVAITQTIAGTDGVSIGADVLGVGTGAVGNVYFGTVTFVNTTTVNVVSPFILGFATSGTSKGEQLTQIDVGAAQDARFILHRISTDATKSQARTSRMTNKIGVYSFALKPEEHQPSGTCNFSRIDNAKLEGSLTTAGASITVYAVNYNVLRIMSGMGGLAYSN